MKSLFNKYIWLQLILSILLLFGGTLIVVFAITDQENILKTGLNIIAAVILFLFGLFAILATLAFESDKYFTNGLLYGSACIALGVFLCMKKIFLLEYLVYLLAIFFIVVGALEIIKGIILIVKKVKVLPIVLTFVIAAIFLAGGIISLIFPDHIQTAFCIIAGVLLFIAGVFLLIFGVKAMVEANKAKDKKSKKVSKKETKKEEVKELDYTAEK